LTLGDETGCRRFLIGIGLQAFAGEFLEFLKIGVLRFYLARLVPPQVAEVS
jgi:hypothetical protein